MTQRRLLLAAILVLIVALFAFDLGRFLSLDYLKARQAALEALYALKRAAAEP